MNGVVGTDLVCQVGFIVKDINATKKKWSEFLGVEEPEAALCGEYETTQTEFKASLHRRPTVILHFLMWDRDCSLN